MAGTPQATTLKLYQAVIADVINNVKEAFQEDGVDDQVLVELKSIWETKLSSSKALEAAEDIPEVKTVPESKNVDTHQNQKPHHAHPQPVQQPPPLAPQQRQQQQIQHPQQQPTQLTSNGSSHSIILPETQKRIAIQITLPPQQGVPGNDKNSAPRVITIEVPQSTLQGNQLQSVLGGSIISAVMSVPTDVATVLLQKHIDDVLRTQQQGAMIPETKPQIFSQFDGANDSTDDDDDDEDDDKDDEDDDDDDDDQDIDDENEENEGIEDEPLNSEDDVSEEDPALFETENIVVCQYDKITRSRNKWKFYLKDGIMNLNGKDFVFQKANGDADW